MPEQNKNDLNVKFNVFRTNSDQKHRRVQPMTQVPLHQAKFKDLEHVGRSCHLRRRAGLFTLASVDANQSDG
jgi:hypothetical protein